MHSFNKSKDLWGNRHGDSRDPQGTASNTALSVYPQEVGLDEIHASPIFPSTPICCWNLCSNVQGRKTARPMNIDAQNF